MSADECLNIVQREYQAGKVAFERGNYRQSVQHLEKASALVRGGSILGGEVKTWLVIAHESLGERTEAIGLCKELCRHPNPETRKQGRRLLYILEAPRLAKRSEWLVKIPDLADLDESDAKDRLGGTTRQRPRRPRPRPEPEPIDLSQVDTKDSGFIWIALGAIALLLGISLWLT